jgi:hypothetical protein
MYHKAIVTYMDILGFTTLIAQSRKNPDLISKIQRDLTDLKAKTSQGGRIHRTATGDVEQIFHSYSFSDLTVRCTLIPENVDLGDYLAWELMYVADMQMRLLRDRIFLRGGICLDDIAVEPKEEIIFGSALVKSYHLEKDYAVFPRVAIDRRLVFEAEKGIKYWSDHVHRGDDGTHFVDYLNGSAMVRYESMDFQESPADVFEAHRSIIVNKIENDNNGETPAPPRVRQKNMWLARYHNLSIQRFTRRMETLKVNIDLSSFLIEEKLLRF